MTEVISAIQAKYDAQKLAFAPVSFQVARSLRNLGILDLAQKNRKQGISVEDISNELKLSIYGVKVLLEFGETLDLVYSIDGNYFVSKTGHFINNDDLTKVNMDFIHDVCYQGLFSLEESIKENRPVGLEVFGKWNTIYEALSQLPDKVKKSWFDFDHYYSDQAFPDVLPLVFERKPKKLFDVGGNTGKWSFQCVAYDPDVEVTILDLPGQLNVALANVEEQNLQHRIKGFEINLLDKSNEFPKNPDAIWMSQFLDCFSEKEIVDILNMAKRSMNSETDLYILETFWNRQRFEASHFAVQATSLYFTSMANGNSKMYHSEDMYNCLDKAGLKVVQDVDDLGVGHTLLRAKVKD